MELQGKSFLITGGVSLIGSHLAERLLKHGASRIVLLDNLLLGSTDKLGTLLSDPRVTFVKGDVLRLPQLIDAMAGIDGVFSMAALLTVPMSKDPEMGLSVNVTGLLNTMNAARIAKVGKVVLASSIAVYGDEIDGLISEKTPFGSSSLAPPFAIYALSKLIGEQIGRYYKASGVDFNAVRFSTVYGERQHERGVNALAIIETYQKIAAGERPVIVGDGSEVHDYLYAGDAAEGAIAAMRAGKPGEVYNIATGVGTSISQIVSYVLKATGSSLEPEHRADERAFRGTTHDHLNIDVSKAARDLGFRAEVSAEDGVRKLITWFQEQPGSAQVSQPVAAR